MPPRAKNSQQLGLEASLWEAANRLRSNMDAAEYKHVVLGLIFLKYVEDAFEERRGVLRDELAAEGITKDAARSCLSPATSTPLRGCSGFRRRPAGST